jgi:integration host factor subunit beta
MDGVYRIEGTNQINTGRAMNKLELINALRNECQISKKEASSVVDLFFAEMSNALAKGDRIEIRGLCSFYVKKYKAYAGRNPKTGEKVKIKAKKLPFFKCGQELKDRVDY